MLEAIIKGDSSSITAKLELKLEEYFITTNKVFSCNYYSVPHSCSFVFEGLQFPKSYNQLIYTTTKVYKLLFIKLGCTLDEYELATNTTRRILINKTCLALLMLLYNQQFREFCNVEESRTEILRHLKLELSKHIAL